jgi:DNA-binding NarL/FixJ family response regulator
MSWWWRSASRAAASGAARRSPRSSTVKRMPSYSISARQSWRLAALREMDGQLNPRIVILTGNLVAASATIERIRPSMPHGAAHLTARELDIVRAVASGLRNKVIAAKLRVTEGTVKVHLHNIYKKLGLDSRLSLVVYWKEHGLA